MVFTLSIIAQKSFHENRASLSTQSECKKKSGKIKVKTIFSLFSSKSSGDGIHWFAIFNAEERLEVFDSLGVQKDLITRNIPAYHKSVIANTTPVQDRNSSSCGLFVCYFLLHRYLSIDVEFEDLLNSIFTESVEENEKKVKDFLEK